ncbi:hypothetical protein XENOCAPTIV_019992 [Xenoophorus captivus]|uniref:Uncharacterized protein n=1 Tax=Xenoophorus captivus TaxID=1517983 RepID=A0ABV0QJ89_9TELE
MWGQQVAVVLLRTRVCDPGVIGQMFGTCLLYLSAVLEPCANSEARDLNPADWAIQLTHSKFTYDHDLRDVPDVPSCRLGPSLLSCSIINLCTSPTKKQQKKKLRCQRSVAKWYHIFMDPKQNSLPPRVHYALTVLTVVVCPLCPSEDLSTTTPSHTQWSSPPECTAEHVPVGPLNCVRYLILNQSGSHMFCMWCANTPVLQNLHRELKSAVILHDLKVSLHVLTHMKVLKAQQAAASVPLYML